MSRNKLIFITVLVLVLSLLAMGADGRAVKSAKGKGGYTYIDPASQEKYVYSFSAKEYTDGSVSGFAKESLEHPWGHYIIYEHEIDIDCLNIFDTDAGRVAAVSGWITTGEEYFIKVYIKTWSGDGYYGNLYGYDPNWMGCKDVDYFPWGGGPANVQIRVVE